MLWLFLCEVSILLVAGIALGIPFALALARFVQSMLFQVSTSNPLGIAAAIALMALGALLASFFPARRDTRVNPVQALRYE